MRKSGCRGALFDLDGTLVDSVGVWARIDREFLARRGIVVPDDYLAAVCSKRFSEAAVYTVERFGLSDTVEGLCVEWLEMARHEYASRVRMIPGAERHLRRLASRGVKLGTVTGLPRALLEAVLKGNGVYDLFESHTSADEAPRGKEFPDVYVLAARKMGLLPQECTVYEDVPVCAASALAAGARVRAICLPGREGRWAEFAGRVELFCSYDELE